MESKFREQVIEYFRNCSDTELFNAVLALSDNNIIATDWSCVGCRKKYGECNVLDLQDDPSEDCCVKRFRAWGMER